MGRKAEIEDLTGIRFGKLTVIENKGRLPDKNGRMDEYWLCQCDCGKQTTAKRRVLVEDTKRSCGCLRGGKKGGKRGKSEYKHKKTLCLSCIRSAAPPSLQCIWEKSKCAVLPDGAKTEVVGIFTDSSLRKGQERIAVTFCPAYLDMNDEKNIKLLKEARRVKL